MKQIIFFTILIAVLFSACEKDTEYSDQKEITSFTFANAISATINETDGTITAELPFGTNIKALTPSIVISSRAKVSPASDVATDFTKPVTYTLTAEDGTTKTYVVTVTVVKIISSFIFEGLNPKVSATIDETNATITAKIPIGTDLTALTPTIVISKNATISPASGTALDFTKPVNYTVTAENGTTKAYVFNVIETIPFISVWKTTEANEKIELPLHDGGVYDFTVNWGDGNSDKITEWNAAEKSHSYTSAGEYTVSITGQIEGFSFRTNQTINGTPNAIIDVTQWGAEFRFGNEGAYFKECTKLKGFTATNAPNLTGTTKMFHMFQSASAFNGDISNWDVSNVTNMSNMFYAAKAFNQDLNNWDVSNVTNMSNMFSGTSVFNGDVSNWDISSVTDMRYMFSNTGVFNRDISNWDVSAITNMEGIFFWAKAFNQDLNNWDVSNVTNMYQMFYASEAFNQDLNNWDVSNVTDMRDMFSWTSTFNGDISNWDVSAVTNMRGIFSETKAFNQDINGWDVSAVTDMRAMFFRASVFNRDISSWVISNVTNMSNMFKGSAFNQDLSNWDVSAVTNMNWMFKDAKVFNQDLSSWDVSQVTSYTDFDTDATAWTNSDWKPNFQ